MTVEAMNGFFAQNGINLDDPARQVRAQIAWVKVVNRQILPRVTVTVDQLDLAVQEARRSEGQPEYLLSEIVLPVDNPAQADRVAQDAARLVQTLREGASFDSLARQVSAAASAEHGGDVGWVRAAAIPPELRDTLERHAPGRNLRSLLRSPVGYHIFWLRDQRMARRPRAHRPGDVEVDLAQILFPVDGSGHRSMRRADSAARLRGRLADCAAMADVAAELKAPDSGELGWLRVGDLPPEFRQAVSGLAGRPGQRAAGRAGRRPSADGLRPARSRSRTPAARPDRPAAQAERVDRLARRYLRDLRKQAFVEVRL